MSVEDARAAILAEIELAAGIKGYSVPGSSVQRHSLVDQINAMHMLDEIKGVEELGGRRFDIELGRVDYLP